MKSRLIEKEALELPVVRRARLAERLLDSLENLSEKEAEKLWASESAQRARQIDKGEVLLVSAEQFERRMRIRLK